VRPGVQRWVQRNGWDLAEPHYERYWRRQLQPVHDEVLSLAALAPGQAVLDVACGTGIVTLRAAQRVGAGGRVTGLDLSPEMAESTAKAAAAAGLANVDTVAGDAEELPRLAPGPYDAALCSLGLMYVPDPRAALAAMLAALRPGGRAVVSVWGERRNCGWAEIFPIVDRRVASDVCPLFFALGAPGALEAAMAGAGFIDVETTRLTTELAYADDEQAVGAAFVGGPVALAQARFDEATRRAAHDEYLASISSYRDDTGYRVPAEFVLAAGWRP
jgi:ubiquinone/menaquinone biosynthesis C-methylase UbiE